MDQLNIVFAVNNDYFFPLTLALKSIKATRSEETNICCYIMYTSISENNLERLISLKERKFNIIPIDVTDWVSGIVGDYREKYLYTYVSEETLYRFIITELFADRKRVLYLDCDVIVQKDLSDLFNSNINDYYAGVITDINVEKKLIQNNMVGGRYFNAGVILFNIPRMRRDNIYEKLISAPVDRFFADQDVLNRVLEGNVKYLPSKYNLQMDAVVNGNVDIARMYYADMRGVSSDDYIKSAVIIHMSGPVKPWIYSVDLFTDLCMSYMGDDNEIDKNTDLIQPYHYVQYNPVNKFSISPFLKIGKGNRIVVYGAGKVGKAYIQQIISGSLYEVVLWVDQKYELYQRQGFRVDNIDSILSVKYDYVLIALDSEKRAKNVREMLMLKGIPDNKIIWCEPIRIRGIWEVSAVMQKARKHA